jgi:hypothetical protein
MIQPCSGKISKKVQKIENPPKQIFRWVLILAFFIFAVKGQINFLNYPDGESKGLFNYLCAVIIFGILTLFMRKKNQKTDTAEDPVITKRLQSYLSEIKHSIQNRTPKSILFSISLILTMLSLFLLSHRALDASYWDILFIWIASILCYAFVFIGKPKPNIRNWLEDHRKDIALVLLFTMLGGLFRFYQLGNIPNIIDGDEGRFGLIINDILEGRMRDMFITTFGNSTMYFFFLAGMMKLFGKSITILRIGSAIGGTLTIPILYLMANHLFNRRTAIISTVILIVSNFHIHFSHIMSVTSIQDAFFATSSLYLFFTGLQKNSAARMTMAGFMMGLALYVYMGARLIILLVPIYVIIMFFIHPHIIKRNYVNLLIFFGALVIISSPMIYWSITNPDLFNIRAHQVGLFQSGWLAEKSLRTGQSQIFIFFDLFKQAFLTTIFTPSYKFHYSSWPMLDMFTSIFFVAGLAYSFFYTKDSRYLLLNGWFWSGILIGGALVILPSLNTYRILIVFPVMCIFSGVGFDKLLCYMKGSGRIAKYLEKAIALGFIMLITVFNLRSYFLNFAPNCVYEEPNTRAAYRIATYASELDQGVNLYLLTAPLLRAHTHLSMSYLSPGRIYNELVNPLTAPPEDLDPNYSYAFFFYPPRYDELQWIESSLPGGTLDTIYDCNNALIKVYLWEP